MRVFKFRLLSSLAVFAFVAAFSTDLIGQDERLIGGGSGITVFEDRNFRGDAATYQNNVASLPSRFNNRISSVRVGAGEQWQVCDQANYRGQCVTVSGEENDLGRNNWDNRISSMRRLSGGGGWDGGGGGGWGSGQTITPPRWAQGTFYGTAPDGNQITLSIANNGSVTANVGGGISYGRFTRGNNLYLNGNTSRVTRVGNGIRTTSNNDGLSISYSRSGWGGGGGGFDPPSASRPPSWATGSFSGRAPDGTPIVLTINSNGSVTSNVGGSMNYGSYNNGIISINESSARVTQIRNGVRTTSTTDGLTINYRRN